MIVKIGVENESVVKYCDNSMEITCEYYGEFLSKKGDSLKSLPGKTV